jgi:hypothetical protein
MTIRNMTLSVFLGVLAALTLWQTPALYSFYQAETAPKVPVVVTGSQSRGLVLHHADGGSVVTDLAFGISVNKGSALKRRWFVIQDPTSPISLGDVGIKSVYKNSEYSGEYHFVSAGDTKTKSAVSAYEILYVLFDVWGERMRVLASTDLVDLPEGVPIKQEGTWYASENDVSEYFTSVAYVDKVMMADGRIWRADRKAIMEKLADVELRVNESALAPDPTPVPPALKPPAR